MASVNKVVLIGNLGRDPEMRYMPSGDAIANFSIATTDNWKDKDGQKQERTEWHRISVFGKLAEICGEYLKKGSPVYVEGKLQTRKWQDKEGNERQTTEVVADRMQMLGGRESTAPDARQPSQSTEKQNDTDYDGDVTRAIPKEVIDKARKAAGFDDFEDDIPF